MPNYKESGSAGTTWWENFLRPRSEIPYEDVEQSLEGVAKDNEQSEFSQLMSLLDLIKFTGLEDYERNVEIETFRTAVKITQVPDLSLEAKRFLTHKGGEEEIKMTFGYEIGVRTISLDSGIRRIQFVLDKEEGSCRVIKKELVEGEWFVQEDFEPEDLADPVTIARLGVKIGESLSKPSSS